MSHISNGQIRWEETPRSAIKVFIASTTKTKDTLQKSVGLYVITWSNWSKLGNWSNSYINLMDRGVCERPRPRPAFYGMMLGQTHVNGWSHVIASQNGGSTSYIFPLRLGVLQWSRHLFNYWKNKKTIIEKFLILLIWNLIYIDHRKITWLWS